MIDQNIIFVYCFINSRGENFFFRSLPKAKEIWTCISVLKSDKMSSDLYEFSLLIISAKNYLFQMICTDSSSTEQFLKPLSNELVFTMPFFSKPKKAPIWKQLVNKDSSLGEIQQVDKNKNNSQVHRAVLGFIHSVPRLE